MSPAKERPGWVGAGLAPGLGVLRGRRGPAEGAASAQEGARPQGRLPRGVLGTLETSKARWVGAYSNPIQGKMSLPMARGAPGELGRSLATQAGLCICGPARPSSPDQPEKATGGTELASAAACHFIYQNKTTLLLPQPFMKSKGGDFKQN